MELHPAMNEHIHMLDIYFWLKEMNTSKFLFGDICLKDTKNKTKKNIKHPKIFVYVIDDEIFSILAVKIV